LSLPSAGENAAGENAAGENAAGANGNGADGVSLPDESPSAIPTASKSAWSFAFQWKTIAVAVFMLAGLANLVLAGSYVIEVLEQRRLASEIVAARDIISGLPAPAETQVRLTRAELALDAEQRAFSTLTSSPAVTQQLLGLAESAGILILEVVTEPGEPEKVGQNTYGALLVTLQVDGSAEAIAAFLYQLEGGFLPGGRIDLVSIERIPPPEDGTEYSSPGWSSRRLTASVGLTVFERQGSWD
jgi:hypothetical protein